MMYESKYDMAREDAVAVAFEKAWDCQVLRNKPFYQIDRTITKNGVVVAYMEIKCRNKQYESVFLSLNKWLAGRQMARETGKPFIAAYGLPNGIYYFATKDEPLGFNIKVTGRTDRHDPNDIQPAVEIPLSEMKRIAA